MRILIGWDDPAEAELISLYLNAGEENQASVTTESTEFLAQAMGEHDWDVVLMTTDSPDSETACRRAAHGHLHVDGESGIHVN